MDCEAEEDLVLRSVYFPEALDDQLRARASRLGKSSGDLIRELVRVGLQRELSVQDRNQEQISSSEPVSRERVEASVRPDYIISFINNKPYKSLKRHLSQNGLDPKAYREMFGLPPDYPMVAKTYAAHRSEIARSLGFGAPKTRDARKAGQKAQNSSSTGRGARRSHREAS